jgi:hypothetical protein
VWSLCHGGPSCGVCGTLHAAHSRSERHACISDVSVQRQRKANPSSSRTAQRCREHAPLSLARPNGERDDRCFASALRSTARRYCPHPALPPCACAQSVPAMRSASACRHARAGHEHATAVVASSRCAPLFRRPRCELHNAPLAVRCTTEAPPYECHTGSCVCFGATSSGARACMCISRRMVRFVSPFRLCRLGPLQSQRASPLSAGAASRFSSRCMHNGMR